MSSHGSAGGKVKFKTDAYKVAKKEMLFVYHQMFVALNQQKLDMGKHKPPTQATKIIPILIPRTVHIGSGQGVPSAVEVGTFKFDDRSRTIEVDIHHGNRSIDDAEQTRLYKNFLHHANKIPKTGTVYGGTIYHETEYGNHEDYFGADYVRAQKLHKAKMRIYR